MSVSVDKENTKLETQKDVPQKKRKSEPPIRREKNSQITIIDSPTQSEALFLNNVSYLNQVYLFEIRFFSYFLTKKVFIFTQNKFPH